VHIVKTVTRNFDAYEVFSIVLKEKFFPGMPMFWRKPEYEEVAVKLEGIIEADDSSGLVVQQVVDGEGRPIFTNGPDEIVYDNPTKLLLLLPNIRQAFHAAGYRPKLSRIYHEKLEIRYKGPLSQLPDVTVKVEPIVEESTEMEAVSSGTRG
jgi:hypothetical protein